MRHLLTFSVKVRIKLLQPPISSSSFYLFVNNYLLKLTTAPRPLLYPRYSLAPGKSCDGSCLKALFSVYGVDLAPLRPSPPLTEAPG